MNSLLLIGAGPMALEHAKVLQALGRRFEVVGRGPESAKKFKEACGVDVVTGGLAAFEKAKKLSSFSHAIVAVHDEALTPIAQQLLGEGIKNILVEKPAGLTLTEIETLAASTKSSQARVFVAYNRRFYSSVKRLREIAQEDGGITSFQFEFTEWSHVIETLPTPILVKNNWFMANSSHVLDLAFFLGGTPESISCFRAGQLSWHPSGSIYAGAGVARGGALFSYQANWESAGRWVVEILTRKHRLLLKPLETLQIQKRGSVAVEPVLISDELDKQFKAGVYRQMQAFLEGGPDLLEIAEHAKLARTYEQIRMGSEA